MGEEGVYLLRSACVPVRNNSRQKAGETGVRRPALVLLFESEWSTDVLESRPRREETGLSGRTGRPRG